jgi:transposase-like protein
MKQKRKHYRPDEKVSMIRRHLIDGVQVSDLCEEHELRPTVYYRWQKEFFEGGVAAFEKDSAREINHLKRLIEQKEDQLRRKNEVLAEVMEEYIVCKKKSGAL